MMVPRPVLFVLGLVLIIDSAVIAVGMTHNEDDRPELYLSSESNGIACNVRMHQDGDTWILSSMTVERVEPLPCECSPGDALVLP